MSKERYLILVSEGVTDCSLLEVLLEKFLDFLPYHNLKDLPEIFRQMVGKYPNVNGGLNRQDSPTFYHNDQVSVAVKQANGYSNIPKKIAGLIEVLEKEDLYAGFGGFLIFCDTDLKSKEEMIEIFRKAFLENDVLYENDALNVNDHTISCKLHLFPEHGNGAVEKLLLDCASITYPFLCEDALAYRREIMQDQYSDLRKKHWAKDIDIQEFYADKVQFGAVSSVLKPDRPVRFTIKDEIFHRKYEQQYQKVTEFQLLMQFLKENL